MSNDRTVLYNRLVNYLHNNEFKILKNEEWRELPQGPKEEIERVKPLGCTTNPHRFKQLGIDIDKIIVYINENKIDETNSCKLRVLLHEMSHATGDINILNRPGINNIKLTRHEIAYEEMIAEASTHALLKKLGYLTPEMEKECVNYIEKMAVQGLPFTLMKLANMELTRDAALASEYVYEKWLTPVLKGFN